MRLEVGRIDHLVVVTGLVDRLQHHPGHPGGQAEAGEADHLISHLPAVLAIQQIVFNEEKRLLLMVGQGDSLQIQQGRVRLL